MLLCVLVIFIISGIFLSIFGVRDRYYKSTILNKIFSTKYKLLMRPPTSKTENSINFFNETFPSRAANIGYSAVGCLIFSLYLIYDTQIMLGGKHKYSLSPEEYIFAALNLYLDIINLFLYLLSIFGSSSSD